MQIPILIRASWRAASILLILALQISVFSSRLTPTLYAAHDHPAQDSDSPPLSAADDVVSDPQIVPRQAVTTTNQVTTTRGSGLSISNLRLPSVADNQEAEEDDAEIASDESAVDEESADSGEQVGERAADSPTPIDSLVDVRQAVIQIEAVGTFVDPAEGLQLNAAGRGSGFIIDPSGIAVTNNHVVTGGGLYRVYVDGEENALNAKVLGVSECADLAVIDIQGDGFPYLTWYEAPIQVGLDVYAVGFPLGDPEFTMTRGIVAKERANGESNWASVDHVIQHDASINPGNSGGPLVNRDGEVVAVNYAGNTQTNQYFAISPEEALPIIERLRAGENVDSIGINGEAVNDGEGLSGIWVSSVKSGSPADQTGIQGGDIILKMEGLVLAEDGTMSTYCDILRSHDPEDVLAVEVLRFATEEVLEGQLNGRELTQSFSLAEELTAVEDTTTTTEGTESTEESTTAAPGYSEYTTITDRTGILALEIPTEWSDVDSGDWVLDEETVGIRLAASTDLEEFFANWGYPGVIFSLSTELANTYTPEEMLDGLQYTSSCIYDGRNEIPEGFFTGLYDIWTECKGDSNGGIVMSLVPEDNAYILMLEIYLASDADLDAVDRILDTFVVDLNDLPDTPTTASTTGDETLFDLVDVSGLEYDYVLMNEQALTALIPAEWADISSEDWVNDDDEQLGYVVSASSDIAAYNDTWTTAGIYVRSATGFEEELNIDDLLDLTDLSDTCTYDDRYSHSHTVYGLTYTGAYDLYSECDGEANAFAYLVVQSDDLNQAVLLEFLAVSDADVEAFGVLLQSFYLGEVVPGEETTPVTDEPDYTAITDETETLVVRVPNDWTDIKSGDWEIDGSVVGVQLEASLDLDAYSNGWETPGIFFAASPEFTGSDPKEILDALDFSEECTLSDRFEYDDSVFVGHYDLWESCGGTATNIVFLATSPVNNPNYLVLIGVQMPTADDFLTLDEIFNSFNLNIASDEADNVTPTATVIVDALNLRNGPGTNYGRIGGVSGGDQLIVLGEYNNCAWLNVRTRSEVVGWVSGNANFIDFPADCAEIPAVEPPTPPQNRGNTSTRPGTASSNSRQGCYLFQNELGPELTITYTRRGDGWNITFRVPADGEYRQCFDPGEYTYTLDAPPPWGSTNGEMTISAGDNFLFPITPGE